MRFVTYNTHFAVGRDGYHDLDRIAAAIDGADVIALQEVERFWPRSGMLDQPKELGKRLPEYWWVYGPTLDLHSPAGFPGEASDRRRQFGNMILSRTPILGSENLRLPRLSNGLRSMRRAALEVVVAPAGRPLRVTSTHLCYLSAATRVAQAQAIFLRHAEASAEGGAWDGVHPADPSWYLGTEPAMPASAVVLGDMNFGPGQPEYATTIGGADSPFVDMWTVVRTDDGASKDGERIDHGWMTPDLVGHLRDAWVDPFASGSDHQPVWFELDIDG